ncbi:MAG TPA: LysR substrate-binding domain-containing protein [Sphingomonas sp.]|nr:LysR substrate-binding domain-containing protein [Sphingomonas sp.]
MTVPSHLRSLQAVELAARTGSFTEAGERLGITPAAVGQRVKALEDYLGIRLLDRRRAGVVATPELAAALPLLERAFADLEAAADTLDLQRGRDLHIAATSDFADLWLKPRLARFRAAHPAIRFRINGAGDAPARTGRADCDIRYAAFTGGDDADVLFRDLVVPVCSPLNRDRVAALPVDERFEGFPLLHLDCYRDDPADLSWSRWFAANAVPRTAPDRGFRFQRITAARDAVVADAGLALCGIALLREAVENGGIALPCGAATGLWSDHGYVACFRADSAAKRHVRQFRNWLAREAADTRTWLARQAGGRNRQGPLSAHGRAF